MGQILWNPASRRKPKINNSTLMSGWMVGFASHIKLSRANRKNDCDNFRIILKIVFACYNLFQVLKEGLPIIFLSN